MEGTQKKSTVLTFVVKLRHCRKWIQEWCTNDFYSIRGRRLKLLGEIQNIDKLEKQSKLLHGLYLKREELKKKIMAGAKLRNNIVENPC